MKADIPSNYIVLLLLIISCKTFSQLPRFEYEATHTKIGTATIEVTYKLEWTDDTIQGKNIKTDILKLHSGGRISKFFSYTLSKNDSLCSALIARHSETIPSEPPEAITEEIYKNFDLNEMMVKNRVDNLTYKYIEEIPELKWIIHSEKEKVNDYLCQKATTKFRGRIYEAWFTSEIPINDGPWKFSGLPGIILKVHDHNNQYIFTCIGIKRVDLPIETCNRKFTLTTREKLNEMLKKKFNNLTSYYAAMGVTYVTKIDGKFVFSPVDASLPYNPIELE